MKIQMYVNGDLHNQLSIDDNELSEELDFEKRVQENEQTMNVYALMMRSWCYNQIKVSRSWELVVIRESKMNNDAQIGEEYNEA